MLLQISTKDSLNSLSVSSGQPDNLMLFIIICSLIIGIIVYFIVQYNKEKKPTSVTKNETESKNADPANADLQSVS